MKWAILLLVASVAATSGCCWRPSWCNQNPQYAVPVYAQPTYAQPTYAAPQPVYAQQPICQPCVPQNQCSCY